MTAKWEKQGTNEGILTFTIPAEEVEAGLNRTFNRVKKNLNVPGFRKGHINRKMFDRMYGEEALYEETLNQLLPMTYPAAVAEAGIDPVARPEIDVESMNKGEDWVIKAHVVVRPEVKLGEYKNLTVEKQNREVTDEDVEKALEGLQNQQAELVVSEDAAKEGDTVTIDFEGFKDGEPFEGGKGENYPLELGSGSFIPGFEDQLVGAKAGDEVEVNVTFPEDYQAEDLAGQPAVFKVKVHEVKSKELPALDDEFAKDVNENVETLAELKDSIREDLTKQRNEEADNNIRNLALEQAVNNAEMEIPDAMIEEEINRSMDQFLQQMQNNGISAEMYYQLTGTNEEALRNQFATEAEQRVSADLVLNAIVEAENIEVSEDDINKEVQDLAKQYNMDEVQVRSVLSEDMLKHDIQIKRAMDMITETAKEAE